MVDAVSLIMSLPAAPRGIQRIVLYSRRAANHNRRWSSAASRYSQRPDLTPRLCTSQACTRPCPTRCAQGTVETPYIFVQALFFSVITYFLFHLQVDAGEARIAVSQSMLDALVFDGPVRVWPATCTGAPEGT